MHALKNVPRKLSRFNKFHCLLNELVDKVIFMRIDFGRYIKKVRQKIIKDAIYSVRVIAWVAVVAATHLLILRHFLYSLCPMVLLTGYPCPSCGMTRAGGLLLKGRFAEAWNLQPFIYILGLFLLAVGVWRYLLLKKQMKWAKQCLIVILFSMIAFYIYRMARYFPDTPPMTYYPNNLMRFILQFAG